MTSLLKSMRFILMLRTKFELKEHSAISASLPLSLMFGDLTSLKTFTVAEGGDFNPKQSDVNTPDLFDLINQVSSLPLAASQCATVMVEAAKKCGNCSRNSKYIFSPLVCRTTTEKFPFSGLPIAGGTTKAVPT